MTSKTCSTCGARFDCGAGDSARPMPLDFSQDCRCPPCLKAEIQSRIAAFVATVTPAQARAGVGLRWASDDALVEDIDYELEGGCLVFTAWYLLKRGACCESGCRHCPYGFEAR